MAAGPLHARFRLVMEPLSSPPLYSSSPSSRRSHSPVASVHEYVSESYAPQSLLVQRKSRAAGAPPWTGSSVTKVEPCVLRGGGYVDLQSVEAGRACPKRIYAVYVVDEAVDVVRVWDVPLSERPHSILDHGLKRPSHHARTFPILRRPRPKALSAFLRRCLDSRSRRRIRKRPRCPPPSRASGSAPPGRRCGPTHQTSRGSSRLP